jgi:hypothetical protein
MADVICNYAAELFLATYVQGKGWVACHVSDPGVAGNIATEVSGAGNDYERIKPTWSAPASKTIGNTTKLDFENMPDCTVTHLAVWTAQAGGYCIMTLELPSPIALDAGDDLEIPAYDLAFSL